MISCQKHFHFRENSRGRRRSQKRRISVRRWWHFEISICYTKMRYKSKQNIRLRSDSEWNFSFSQIKGYLTSTVVTLDLEKNLCPDEMKELVEQGINNFTPRLKSSVSLVKRKKNSKKKKHREGKEVVINCHSSWQPKRVPAALERNPLCWVGGTFW